MPQTKAYHSRQRARIEACLRAALPGHLTAEEIAAALHAQGADIALATIYRNLDRLAGDGTVLKYTLPGGLRACYRYLGHGDDDAPHSHLVCTGCGEVIHLGCAEMASFSTHLLAEHQFRVDLGRTVFYGRCAACAANGEAGV